MQPGRAHRVGYGPPARNLWPPSARGLKIAGLLIGVIWPLVLLADQVSKSHVAWATLIVAVTSVIALLAWRDPVAIGILVVLAALVMVPVTLWAVSLGMGLAEETPHLTDYARAVLLFPGPFLLAGVLLLVASKDLPG